MVIVTMTDVLDLSGVQAQFFEAGHQHIERINMRPSLVSMAQATETKVIEVLEGRVGSTT